VTIDAGSGSANAVNRVASGTYDMGFADMAALMEFTPTTRCAGQAGGRDDGLQRHAGRHHRAQKVGHQNPADLAGKKLGAPVFDAGRRAYPIFAKANKLEPPSRRSPAWTRRCAKPCCCAAMWMPSPASPSPRC
jgi:NitT/TauT family transport system substrate-binding protein